MTKDEWRLLKRYEREVAAYAAELRRAARRRQPGKVNRLQARLAAFADECAAIAECFPEYEREDPRIDQNS
jgi:hypothetical protein